MKKKSDIILGFIEKYGASNPAAYEDILEIWENSPLSEELKAALVEYVEPNDDVATHLKFYRNTHKALNNI